MAHELKDRGPRDRSQINGDRGLGGPVVVQRIGLHDDPTCERDQISWADGRQGAAYPKKPKVRNSDGNP
jgi:hypothetical protein